MKKRKIILTIIILLLVIILTIIFIPIKIFFINMYRDNRMPRQGIHEMQKDFEENKELILIIRDYFAASRHARLSYPSRSGESGMLWSGTMSRNIAISDENMEHAIYRLFSSGYRQVVKEDSFISFIRWGNTGAGVGVVYSIGGAIPCSTAIQFLTELEPLTEDGWFYFEVHYNTYRTRLRNQNR